MNFLFSVSEKTYYIEAGTTESDKIKIKKFVEIFHGQLANELSDKVQWVITSDAKKRRQPSDEGPKSLMMATVSAVVEQNNNYNREEKNYNDSLHMDQSPEGVNFFEDANTCQFSDSSEDETNIIIPELDSDLESVRDIHSMLDEIVTETPESSSKLCQRDIIPISDLPTLVISNSPDNRQPYQPSSPASSSIELCPLPRRPSKQQNAPSSAGRKSKQRAKERIKEQLREDSCDETRPMKRARVGRRINQGRKFPSEGDFLALYKEPLSRAINRKFPKEGDFLSLYKEPLSRAINRKFPKEGDFLSLYKEPLSRAVNQQTN